MARHGRSGDDLTPAGWRPTVEDEVDSELAFHVEMRTREYIARGMSPEAARAAAVARFGDISAVNGACRDIGRARERGMRRSAYLSDLLLDAKFAVRHLLRTPVFSLITVATLALGIGATTAIFSAVEAVVLRPFPFARPSELVFVFNRWRGNDGSVAVGDFADWRRRSRSFSQLAAIQFRGMTISTNGSPDRVLGSATTASLFPLLGVAPRLGRVFTAEEDQPGRNGVAVLSDGLWRRAFGGDSLVIGRRIMLDGRATTVVGVMPPGFDPTDSHEELWVPAAFTPERLAYHDEHYLTVLGRLAPGATLAAAQREMDAIAARMAVEYPKTNAENGVHVQAYERTVIGDERGRLLMFLGAVSCVLLIACGNVANLLLARGAARSKELAIRGAIGAGRGRIVRLLLTESLVLALAGSIVGLGLAWVGVHLLIRMAPASIPRLGLARVDGGVLLFALGVALVSALVFGLVPSLRAARAGLQRVLREAGPRGAAGARDGVRSALIMSEVAITVTLLAGAGLLVRSAIQLSRVDPGFDPSGVLSARVALPSVEYKQGAVEAEQTFARIAAAIGALPGVRSAALTSQAPMGPGGGSNGIIPEGKAISLENAVDARLRMVTPGYLAAMRIPLVAGRDIEARDVAGGLRVAVVSAALAKALWHDENPIGKRIICCEGSPEDPRFKTVVGVAADVRSGGPATDVRPEFYLPMAQVPPEAWSWINRTMTAVARARNGDAVSLAPGFRAAVASVDASLPVYDVTTMEDRVHRSLAQPRFQLALLSTLAAVALLLAAAGVYGVVSYFVMLRTHEIGVRMALGATSGDVMRLIALQGLRPVAAGIAAGAIAAVWATRLLRGSLHGVAAGDPATFAVVVVVLLVVSLCAILVPARRATTVDVTAAFRG